jgi:hypothetical protein
MCASYPSGNQEFDNVNDLSNFIAEKTGQDPIRIKQ